MLVECPTCQAKVDGQLVADHYHRNYEENTDLCTSLLACPSCRSPLLVTREAIEYSLNDDPIWGSPSRVFPAAALLPYYVPDALRRSFTEARTCLHAGCRLAAALMCRRTLEALCHHHNLGTSNLAAGLKQLYEKKIINDRLLEWADALRNDGNLAAHDPEADISHQDAADLVHFTQAIIDYVFVLHQRFEAYKERREKREAAPTPPQTSGEEGAG